jgi:hypothetical protein
VPTLGGNGGGEELDCSAGVIEKSVKLPSDGYGDLPDFESILTETHERLNDSSF